MTCHFVEKVVLINFVIKKSFSCFGVTETLKERQNNQGEKRFAFLSFFVFRENDIREEGKLNPFFYFNPSD